MAIRQTLNLFHVGSTPATSTKASIWDCSSAGYNACLSRMRSRVQVPSIPQFKIDNTGKIHERKRKIVI